MNLKLYKKKLGNQGYSTGQARKSNSDMILLNTWDNDIQSKKCYIYDYLHDEEGQKTPIDAKYIVTQYGSLSKDQVEYHILFKPNSGCILDYYKQYQDKYNARYPIGLYIDIPDADGNYQKWLICSSDNEQQFVKHSILPCNYEFKWIHNGEKYAMWGVARMRNSYNSGIYVDHSTTVVENQDQIWLPMNDVSTTLYYGDRIIISALIEKPITWYVSKVENIHPFGLNKLTVAQDKFNAQTDYVNLETGEMYADYYLNNIIPEDYEEVPTVWNGKIIVSGANNQIKVPNYRKKLSVEFDDNTFLSDFSWVVECENTTILDLINIEYDGDYNEILKLSSSSFDAVDSVLSIYIVDAEGNKITDTTNLEVVSF